MGTHIMGNLQVARLNYQGHVIADKGDMLSLTDMWKAAGGEDARRPSDWLALSSTKEFREAVEATLDAGNPGIQVKRGGRGVGGETFAHWQIGLAYAKYLSPDFHMWCNTQVRAVIEGKVPATIPANVVEMLRRTDGIAKMLAHTSLICRRP
ncbi:KilA-N domain-containing protein [Rhizobium sp. P32RR-XVIII]|uniref:KilA-N domain-containing protein n=1 Tax=Rhizobium sp. P32RR-XVIII TaxID=2726738 RepID=UPI001456F20A|nr:KilA-N domain-containing protein [Rhizobium sp. P32RR-XVIII]NLS06278.1 KilA-N domain-containing protein [Rhizobium sp. P32RR-XVIII]